MSLEKQTYIYNRYFGQSAEPSPTPDVDSHTRRPSSEPIVKGSLDIGQTFSPAEPSATPNLRPLGQDDQVSQSNETAGRSGHSPTEQQWETPKPKHRFRPRRPPATVCLTQQQRQQQQQQQLTLAVDPALTTNTYEHIEDSPSSAPPRSLAVADNFQRDRGDTDGTGLAQRGQKAEPCQGNSSLTLARTRTLIRYR